MKHLISVCVAFGAFLLPRHAIAVTIQVDPGPIGQMTYGLTLAVPELIGPAVPGESLSVNFTYTDMKNLEVASPSAQPLLFTLFLGTDVASTSSNISIQDGFLTDKFNSPLAIPPSSLFIQPAGNGAFYSLQFDSPYQSTHHGIRWDITLPDDPNLSQITSAQYEIDTSGGTLNPFLTVTVGETVVPEPSTFLVCSLLLLIPFLRNGR